MSDPRFEALVAIVTDNDSTEWQRVLEINVIGTANVIRARLRHRAGSASAQFMSSLRTCFANQVRLS